MEGKIHEDVLISKRVGITEPFRIDHLTDLTNLCGESLQNYWTFKVTRNFKRTNELPTDHCSFTISKGFI